MSSFRKRNVVISKKGDASTTTATATATQVMATPGVRPSPVTGHATTSTGTASLDKLLGLGAGLALGSSLMVEEQGTTEFARSLLSCHAAEGVLQGHAVFVVGPEGSLPLPGVAEARDNGRRTARVESEKMKIAWRYERLGSFGHRERGGFRLYPSYCYNLYNLALHLACSAPRFAHVILGPLQQQSSSDDASRPLEAPTRPFCHAFDLTKRLAIPSSSQPPKCISPSSSGSASPFTPLLTALTAHLTSSPPTPTPTRLIIPSLLSPLIYPPSSSHPHHLLSFLHQLRALLRSHTTLTAILSWPLALYPATHPLTRYCRHLCDGVITLRPFPHSFSIDAIDLDSGSTGKDKREEEKMQGLIMVLKLPVLTDKGISVGVGEDMAFAVGRRSFLIRPFHLPPLEAEDEDAGGHEGHGHEVKEGGKIEAKSLEF